MMAGVAVFVLVVLLWAWWFDHYRRRPRRGGGAIDDTAIERDRSLAHRPSIHESQHQHPGMGGGFGG